MKNRKFLFTMITTFMLTFLFSGLHAQKGHYSRGKGSSHKGGSYKNSSTGNQYRIRH